MKSNGLMVIMAAIALIAFNQSSAQPKIPMSTKEFMREKLEHAQKVLEAITLEDFDTAVARARKLSVMTHDARWEAFQNPDYVQFSAAFRRNADALAKAASEKNIDGATLGYVRVTMSCVECHKFVRGKLVASIPSDRRLALTSLP